MPWHNGPNVSIKNAPRASNLRAATPPPPPSYGKGGWPNLPMGKHLNTSALYAFRPRSYPVTGAGVKGGEAGQVRTCGQPGHSLHFSPRRSFTHKHLSNNTKRNWTVNNLFEELPWRYFSIAWHLFSLVKPHLYLIVKQNVVDPDPHRSALNLVGWIRIRIQEG